MPFREAQTVSEVYGTQAYVLKGVELDTSILMQQPHPVHFCAGIIEELGMNAMRLDRLYGTLIGPDSARLPRPPVLSSSE